MKKRHLIGGIALLAAAALSLTACSANADEQAKNSDSAGKGTITVGFLPNWTDGLSTAYLLNDQLTKLGYEVKLTELTEASVLYTGLTTGEIDIYPSAWPEVTHREYMQKYGDKLEDLGTYYEGAALTIAVPEYMEDINSLSDLKGQSKRFNGEIIGIEPSAGLTKQTEEVMIPAYGLSDEFELVTSSTATMLATLQTKIAAKEPVVVTLWKPFWANSVFPVKELKDPEGAMGETEGMHFLATKGFSKKYPEVSEYIAKIKLDDSAYGALEKTMTDEQYKDDPAAGFTSWLRESPTAYPGLISDK